MTEQTVVHRLYEAFRAGDGAGMRACYAANATFRDPVFELNGADEIGAMWTMLCEQGDGLTLEVSDVRADATSGSAHWVATYPFGPDARRVVNRIDASFVLDEGLIVRHVDEFGFWRWSRQALGPLGTALGWTPMVRSQVQARARRGLDRWRAER